MEIGWTDVGTWGYILVSTAHSNTSFFRFFSAKLVRTHNNSGTAKVKIVKNERDPPLFTGNLLIKFQNILRNTTQVIIRHRVKITFSVKSSPITLERQKLKSSKMKGILLSSPVSC
jgi:CHASE1-domain containing sensor protein